MSHKEVKESMSISVSITEHTFFHVHTDKWGNAMWFDFHLYLWSFAVLVCLLPQVLSTQLLCLFPLYSWNWLYIGSSFRTRLQLQRSLSRKWRLQRVTTRYANYFKTLILSPRLFLKYYLKIRLKLQKTKVNILAYRSVSGREITQTVQNLDII